MPEFQINYLAAGVAALATVFIGALWYSPLVSHTLGEGPRMLGREGRADAKDGRPSLHGVTVLLCSDGLRSRGARFLDGRVDGAAVDGLKTGAIFGLLLGIAISFDLYAVTNWSNMTVAFVEPFVTAVRIALAGAVIGWTLGKTTPSEIRS